MGSQSSSARQVQNEIKISHPKIKSLRMMPNNDIMHAMINVEQQSQFYGWESKLAKLKNYDEYYLLLPKAYSFSKKGVCGSSGVLQVDYDNYPFLLSQQIQNRIQNGNYFNQYELWYLYYGLCSAASIMKKTDSKIGDVQSRNIFLNPQGQVKVANMYSWPNQNTNYQKLVLQNMNSYVSPQQLQLSKQGRIDIYSKNSKNNNKSCDKYISQSFSIGLTMLQAAILVDNSVLYNVNSKSLNLQELSKRIAYLLTNNNNATQYSKCLRMTIAAMCQISPHDRLQSTIVYDILRLHDSQVSNLKPCNIQTPNIKNRAIYEQIMDERYFKNPNANLNSNININNNVNTNTTIKSTNGGPVSQQRAPDNLSQTNFILGNQPVNLSAQKHNISNTVSYYNKSPNTGTGVGANSINPNTATNLYSSPYNTNINPTIYSANPNTNLNGISNTSAGISSMNPNMNNMGSPNYKPSTSNYIYETKASGMNNSNSALSSNYISAYSANPISTNNLTNNYTSIKYDKTSNPSTIGYNTVSTGYNTSVYAKNLNTYTNSSTNSAGYKPANVNSKPSDTSTTQHINTIHHIGGSHHAYQTDKYANASLTTTSFNTITYSKPQPNKLQPNGNPINSTSNTLNIDQTSYLSRQNNGGIYTGMQKDNLALKKTQPNQGSAAPNSNLNDPTKKWQTWEMGTGNTYLNNLYSMPQPSLSTPTFQNHFNNNSFSFNSGQKQIGVPLTSITTTTTTISSMKTNAVTLKPDDGKESSNIQNSVDNKLQQYSFSNISSIPHRQQFSTDKKNINQNLNVNMFTPTQAQPQINKDVSNRGKDNSSLDLLKKINEQIQSSMKKFSE